MIKKKNAPKKTKKTSRSAKSVRKASDARDIVELILKDHKPLKKLIETMKDSEADLDEVRDAFEEFAPLLINHAKPEEQALYTKMKEREDDLRCEGFEGDTEHAIADNLVKEIQTTRDEDEYRAKVKVLAELVEHHIEEEEEEMLKDVRKEFELEERVSMGKKYTALYEQYANDLAAAA